MVNNLECEIKALVTESEFETLMERYLSKGEIREQDNIYFGDTKGVFKALKYGMRIRSKANNDKLTLKIPQENGLLEINQIISKEEINLILAGNFLPNGDVKDALLKVNVLPSDIEVIGRLHTTRLLVMDKDFELCLDKNTYNDTVDYEIEVEGPTLELAHEYIENFFKKEKILFKENHLSKYVRACKH
ncbi:MAG: CYTH domain-containing protein [Bacilli bacterium]|nr:CYTH domain-containing protein [Bacilli bacterium]